MPNHTYIYENQAALYELMVSKQPLLSDVIARIAPYSGRYILDLGAGSGRLTAELANKAASVTATDLSPAMLDVLRERLARLDARTPVLTYAADHRQLPLADQSFDLVVSGWSICYLTQSHLPEWSDNLAAVMNEIDRVLKPGGSMIILETMGTGYTEPHPPEFLKPYYQALEQEYGFRHDWLRLDYTFDSVEQAAELTRFFFGDELGDTVKRNNWSVVPECAGIWWKRK
ncbi:Methyltransferase domain-containing protein [Paenibacillus sp. UNCCL117]|uniref:class I SAM-dependent methyltransferase n=1 Tax=unclassified Paenibacillus TaxID=185978 RepID=UPI0008892D4C|nr:MULTISPECIES: class I SAM-dependent methyltransferase [unclassified Paenibacillus]SDD79238.1 Methyltransferase domain-containing protein [Paenibacillus sp. cl123]SFW53154.1 Methyltransferase domain-containing protein [Paenibacillus sp. UNCCL117]